jgi:hypothetical protein
MTLLCGTNCEDDSATLLLLREPDTSSPNSSTSCRKETHDVPESFHVAQQVQKDTGVAVHAGDMEVFSVVPLPDRCFMVSAVMHARHALHLKCCYEPVFSYISRSTVIQNSLSPILLRSWPRLLVLL